MARALEGHERFHSSLHHEGGVGVGAVHPGSTSGLAWNEERTRVVALDGALYDVPDLERRLRDAGEDPAGLDSAGLVMRLYECFGVECAAMFNGAFALALWDRPAGQLVLVNDRLGQMPLYYSRVGEGLVFAGGVRSLLADPDVDRSADEVAINQFLVFDHALHDRTLLRSVRLLPPGSILTFRNGDVGIQSYWSPQYPETYDDRSEADLLDEFVHYLRQAVARQAAEPLPAAMLLSGGLDSRLLLGVLGEVGPLPRTLTFGIPGCDDARVASAVARAMGTRHEFVELRSDWLRDLAERAVRLTDGLGNIVNLHALPGIEETPSEHPVVYKGVMGDALFGFALKRQMWADYEAETRYAVHLGVHDDQGVVNYTAEQQRKLLTEDFRTRVGDAVSESYREGMDRAGASQLASQRLYFDLTQRVPRMTINGVEVTRSRSVVRLPFCDNDLVDFALTIPPGFLFERYLPTAAIIRYFPDLAKIPIAGTGRPLRSCARDVWVQARTLLSWHLRDRGLGGLLGPQRRPYKDYDTWFRTVLREWVEEILLDRTTLGRGYFQPEYVRQLVAEHGAGTNHAVRLGALITLELWHRQCVDSTSGDAD